MSPYIMYKKKCTAQGNAAFRGCGKYIMITDADLFLTEDHFDKTTQSYCAPKKFVSFECSHCGAVTDLRRADDSDTKKLFDYTDWKLRKDGPNDRVSHHNKISKYSHEEKQTKMCGIKVKYQWADHAPAT